MIQILISFLAGVLTVASPCILPILPIVLGASVNRQSRLRPLFIVLGFVCTFSLLATFLSVLAQSFGFDSNHVRVVGIVVLAVFGILMVWPEAFDRIMAPINSRFLRAGRLANPEKSDNWSGFVLGLVLGIVWTPCAGPVLGSILALIAIQKSFSVALILLLAYSLGAGVPMLLIGYGSQRLTGRLGPLAAHARRFQQIFGVLVILLSIAMYFNYDVYIYSQILKVFPIFNPKL